MRLARGGTPVAGICGGFQMLGRSIRDPDRVESADEVVEGLGLLPVDTVFAREKTTRQVNGRVAWGRGLLEGTQGMGVTGYEIHMGQSRAEGLSPSFLVQADGEEPHADGAADDHGLVFGTYLHGLFHDQTFRTAFLNNLRRRKGLSPQGPSALPSKDEYYDRLADLVRGSLDMGRIYEICGLGR